MCYPVPNDGDSDGAAKMDADTVNLAGIRAYLGSTPAAMKIGEIGAIYAKGSECA